MSGIKVCTLLGYDIGLTIVGTQASCIAFEISLGGIQETPGVAPDGHMKAILHPVPVY